MTQRFESYIATDETVEMLLSLGNLSIGAFLEVDVYARESHPDSAVLNLQYGSLANRLKADETLLAYYLDRARTSNRFVGVIRSQDDFTELVKLATTEEKILLCHIIGIAEGPLEELIKTTLPETNKWMTRS